MGSMFDAFSKGTKPNQDSARHLENLVRAKGKPFANYVEAMKAWSDGDRIFAFHEMDEDHPFEIETFDHFQAYGHDQMLWVSQSDAAVAAALRGQRKNDKIAEGTQDIVPRLPAEAGQGAPGLLYIHSVGECAAIRIDAGARPAPPGQSTGGTSPNAAPRTLTESRRRNELRNDQLESGAGSESRINETQGRRAPKQGEGENPWSIKGTPHWHSVVREVRGDGHHVKTADDGEVWNVPGYGLHLRALSAHAIAFAAAEVAARGAGPVVIEATNTRIAHAIKKALEERGVAVSGVEITQTPGRGAAAQTSREAQFQDPAQADHVEQQRVIVPQQAARPQVTGTPSLLRDRGVLDVSALSLTEDDGFMVIEGEQECWCCKNQTPVFAIELHDAAMPQTSAGDRGELVSGPLKFVRQINPEALHAIANLGGNLQMRSTKALAGTPYLANVCTKCDEVQGDHFLHEASGAFGMNSAGTLVAHHVDVPLRGSALVMLDYPRGETLADLAEPQSRDRVSGQRFGM